MNRLIDSLKIRATPAKSKVMFQSGWTLLSNEKDAITGGDEELGRLGEDEAGLDGVETTGTVEMRNAQKERRGTI